MKIIRVNKDIVKEISENFIKENRKEIIEEFQASFDLIYSELELDPLIKTNFIGKLEGISFSELNITDLSLIGIIYHVFNFAKSALGETNMEDLVPNFEEHISNLEKNFIEKGYNWGLIQFITKYLLSSYQRYSKNEI